MSNIPCNTCIHADVCAYKQQMQEIKIESSHPFAKVTIKCEKHMQSTQAVSSMVR